LASVEIATGTPTCIDSTLEVVNFDLKSGIGHNPGNVPIQFDARGNLYYAGQSSCNFGCPDVLRKYSNGQIVDLINDQVRLNNFLVTDDGTVFIKGYTVSTQRNWFRRISPAGNIKTLSTEMVHSLWKYADGNVYVGVGGSTYGIQKYIPSLDELEAKFWVAGNNGTADRYFSTGPGIGQLIKECTDSTIPLIVRQSFCSYNGTASGPMFNILGATFGVAGYSPGNSRSLWQFYPVVRRANLQRISEVSIATRAGSAILLAGVDARGRNVMSLFEPSANQETIVMDDTNEIEIYSMSYNSARNSVLFNGLRFSDNRFVVGEVSLN
jgi:hypothetical protein